MIAETLSQNPSSASTRSAANGQAENGCVAAESVAVKNVEESATRPLRWNRDDYARLTGLGFSEDRRVELIEGEIIEMAAVNTARTGRL